MLNELQTTVCSCVGVCLCGRLKTEVTPQPSSDSTATQYTVNNQLILNNRHLKLSIFLQLSSFSNTKVNARVKGDDDVQCSHCSPEEQLLDVFQEFPEIIQSTSINLNMFLLLSAFVHVFKLSRRKTATVVSTNLFKAGVFKV